MLTTPLFYASGDPHIGHAYTLLLASLTKKYYQLIGKKVYLLTGVDEHGEKILLNAKNANLEPQAFVDQISQKFQHLNQALELSSDFFIRTSSTEHKAFVKSFFNDLVKSGNIYLSQWSGYQCINCETNYSTKYYEKSNLCEMGHELIIRSEESYFLKVKEFKDWFLDYYQKKHIIFPDHYRSNLETGIINELEDLSVSRRNLEWGIQLDKHNFCVYVWFDALLGYLSNPLINKKWKNKELQIIQIIGKEIFKFHSIYFPLLLEAKKLTLPCKLMVHGWLINQKNRKISKSEASLIEKPLPKILQEFSLETLRWYCAYLNWGQDHVFSEELLKEYHNKYLLNLHGNLINRLKGILLKNNLTTSKLGSSKDFQVTEFQREFELGSQLLEQIQSKIENLEFWWIINQVVSLLENANHLLEKFEPWKLEISSLEYKELNVLLYRQLVLASYLFSPIFRESKWQEIKESLNISNKEEKLDSLFLNCLLNFEGISLPKSHNLFVKY
ncbi:methionyl-tRNA synthetase [Mycoplasma ovis str. Michigan]|uniref:Methionine--tRNA ligase n=1 Tax=Mycoplasma ovis str. Michigan TaxID=1415773 RepID=A0ABM5P053_9MOLU|nr:methionyl-tRNA synthetase [Mycoplasma ovis str. Michigan]